MLNPSNQGKIMDKRIGAGGIFAIIVGIITLGGLVSVGLLRKTVGIVLIMLVGIYAVSNIKGDFIGLIKDYNIRSEAADIRKLEFERERMKLEAETRLKTLELEAKRTEAERLSKERERIRSERAAAEAAKLAAKLESDRVIENQVNKVLVDGGFSFLEKDNFQEIHYKFRTSQYLASSKIVTLDIILSKNDLTTSSKGLKWRSERYTLEYHCISNLARLSNGTVYDGPLNTGKVVLSSEAATEWAEPKAWQKKWSPKWCAAQ